MALFDQYGKDVPYCFNRKEAKTHGEGGNLVGSPLQGKVMLVDDVITAGTAIRESMQLIQAQGASLSGVLIALDRQEKGQGELSAIQEVERDFGTQVVFYHLFKRLNQLPARQTRAGPVFRSCVCLSCPIWCELGF